MNGVNIDSVSVLKTRGSQNAFYIFVNIVMCIYLWVIVWLCDDLKKILSPIPGPNYLEINPTVLNGICFSVVNFTVFSRAFSKR